MERKRTRLILNNSPLEVYSIGSRRIWVKREDLCAPDGAPPFSKLRGLIPHLQEMKRDGCSSVAYVETAVSMAGWGVAWACQHLGMHCVIYEPQYKNPPPIFLFHKAQWEKFGAEIEPMRGDLMTKVMWNIVRADLAENRPGTALLPLGISFPHSISETALEVRRTWKAGPREGFGAVVAVVGSGTIAAGLLHGLEGLSLRDPIALYGVLSRSGSLSQKRTKIIKLAGLSETGFLSPRNRMELIDVGYDYAKPAKTNAPFPCHPYYDGKAWEWLTQNVDALESDVLFWNVGSMPEVMP